MEGTSTEWLDRWGPLGTRWEMRLEWLSYHVLRAWASMLEALETDGRLFYEDEGGPILHLGVLSLVAAVKTD